LIITGCLVPMFFQVKFLSRFLALLLNYLTGFTEQLTAHTAALPYSTIENIGSTTLECILLTCTIFLSVCFVLKKKSIPVFYPLLFLIFFVFAEAARDFSLKSTNELIVYNSQGTSVIGIRTGKILNLFSDTTIVAPEVKRHCATLGLRIKSTVLSKNYYCLRAGGKNILITNFVNNKIIHDFVPDILVLRGSRPGIASDLDLKHARVMVIVTSEVTAGLRIPPQIAITGMDSIHFVRKAGAFIRAI